MNDRPVRKTVTLSVLGRELPDSSSTRAQIDQLLPDLLLNIRGQWTTDQVQSNLSRVEVQIVMQQGREYGPMD